MPNKTISDIDANFRIKPVENTDELSFYNIESSPFCVHGIFKENGKFRRMPESAARAVNEGVYLLHTNTAGGRVKFKTNSPSISIKAKMPTICKASHFAFTGSSGFDLYVKSDNNTEQYLGSFVPPADITDGYESRLETFFDKMREYTINFPLYSDVSELLIGIKKDADIEPSQSYLHSKPVVYYGSSITQGGCASRPGNSYQSRISRELDCDYINLGFSGSAHGEIKMAEYIAALDMSAFVYDYDHNAPDANHLENTHKPFFDIIRKANPELPVIILSSPKYCLNPEWQKRRNIIKNTYREAVSDGDKNTYFIDGKELMRYAQFDGTVDNCHPNDLGFYSMAKAITKYLKKVL